MIEAPRLKNKTAVITGASSGIGAAIAIRFAAAGGAVVVNYKSGRERADDVVRRITDAGGKAFAIGADVADGSEVLRLIDASGEALGKIDIWVNNAGADVLTGAAAAFDDWKKLHALLEVDLKGTINCCWGVLPFMRKAGGGVIINMSWDMAIHGFRGVNPQMFAAVKAGVYGYSRALAKTEAPTVRVNLLAPGWIETKFSREEMPREYRRERIADIPLGRFGTPEDVAHAALYLASDEASYLTGQTIHVNGGLV